jgi:peptidoglycan hydrolase-like protein with peptidoglycan-binding domain
MFLASKIVCAGIAFTLLTTGILIQNLPRSAAAGSDSNKEGVAAADQNEIKKVQETLRNKGHYRGKVDGIFGLQTQASIRAYQKAEILPVTGQLDTQTAGKLGVRPEGREQTGYETTKGKPSAYIKWAKGSERTSKTPPTTDKTVAAPESGRGDREKTLEADNDNHQQ